MLLNDLYHFTKITEEPDGSGHLIHTEINRKHQIFEGHFPEMPILPGVCHMQMVVDAAAQVLNRHLKVEEGIDMKFTAVVDPREGTQLLIKINLHEQEENRVRVESITTFNGLICFKFKGVLH